jgi:hypothetical protein
MPKASGHGIKKTLRGRKSKARLNVVKSPTARARGRANLHRLEGTWEDFQTDRANPNRAVLHAPYASRGGPIRATE